MSDLESEQDNRTPDTPVEGFIRNHHELLTLSGIFSGISVYFIQLSQTSDGSQPGLLVQLGIAGALVFTLLLFILIMRNALSQITRAVQKNSILNIAGYVTILAGMTGVLISSVAVMMMYQEGSLRLVDLIFGVVLLVVYFTSSQYDWRDESASEDGLLVAVSDNIYGLSLTLWLCIGGIITYDYGFENSISYLTESITWAVFLFIFGHAVSVGLVFFVAGFIADLRS